MAKRITEGERLPGIPGESWNEFVDAAEKIKRLPAPAGKAGAVSTLSRALTIACKNTSGADYTADFPIVRLVDPVITPADYANVVHQHLVLEVDDPDATNAHWGVMQGPCVNGKQQQTVVSGYTWATVNVTDASHTTCGPTNNEATKLESGGAGASIVYKPAGTGDLVCLVKLGESQESILDMAYFTVGSYDAVNQVITTSGTPVSLPTGTPAVPAGVKVYDREGAGFSASDTGYAIRQVAVHTDGTHGQVDWVVIPTAAGTPIKKLTIAKEDSGQAAGDPVSPLSTGLYFAASIDGGSTNVWALLDDNKRLGRTWLPALAEFEGIQNGTYDPNDDDSGITSDERPLYRMQPPSDGETVARVTTAASAGDWTTLSAPVPSSDGRCTTYKRDDQGDVVEDETGVAFENFGDGGIAVGTKIALEEFQGRRIGRAVDGPSSDLLLAKITAQVPARSSDTYGSLATVDLGHLVAGVWTETVSDVTVYNPSLSTVNVDGGTVHIPVAKINNHWILLNATDLLQVDGWVTANDQSIGHDASGTDVLWQDDSECPA